MAGGGDKKRRRGIGLNLTLAQHDQEKMPGGRDEKRKQCDSNLRAEDSHEGKFNQMGSEGGLLADQNFREQPGDGVPENEGLPKGVVSGSVYKQGTSQETSPVITKVGSLDELLSVKAAEATRGRTLRKIKMETKDNLGDVVDQKEAHGAIEDLSGGTTELGTDKAVSNPKEARKRTRRHYPGKYLGVTKKLRRYCPQSSDYKDLGLTHGRKLLDTWEEEVIEQNRIISRLKFAIAQIQLGLQPSSDSSSSTGSDGSEAFGITSSQLGVEPSSDNGSATGSDGSEAFAIAASQLGVELCNERIFERQQGVEPSSDSCSSTGGSTGGDGFEAFGIGASQLAVELFSERIFESQQGVEPISDSSSSTGSDGSEACEIAANQLRVEPSSDRSSSTGSDGSETSSADSSDSSSSTGSDGSEARSDSTGSSTGSGGSEPGNDSSSSTGSDGSQAGTSAMYRTLWDNPYALVAE